MIEVFKTNVTRRDQAAVLIDEIQKRFSDYNANFDLDDCDRILRVITERLPVASGLVVGLLKDLGFEAEVLSEDLPVSR